MQIQKRRRYGQPSNGICSKSGGFVPTRFVVLSQSKLFVKQFNGLPCDYPWMCTQHEWGVDISPINEVIESTKKVIVEVFWRKGGGGMRQNPSFSCRLRLTAPLIREEENRTLNQLPVSSILVTGRSDGKRTGRILLLNLEIFLIDKNQIFEIQDKYKRMWISPGADRGKSKQQNHAHLVEEMVFCGNNFK